MTIHIPAAYKGRLTEYPGYDWDNAPLEAPMIPVPDLQAEADGVPQGVAERPLATIALAHAVPAIAARRQAA